MNSRDIEGTPQRDRSQIVGAFTLAAFVLGTTPGALSAQPDLSGSWRAGVTTMQVAIESWGNDCGPRPQGSRSEGGGSVTISQSAGELTIHARGREVKTGACWSQNPTMRKLQSSVQDGAWTTRCRTPKDDPREEIGTYSISIEGEGLLRYRDVSHYNWRLKDSTCVATITTTQMLSRAAAGTNPPAPAPETEPPAQTPAPAATGQPAEEPEDSRCTPGAARNLTLRPAEAQIELGERICFHARVTDRAGCPLRRPAIAWSLSNSKAVKGQLSDGCFVAGQNAAEAEGEFRIKASHRGLSAHAVVQVHAPDLSAFLAKRLEIGGLTGFEREAAPAKRTATPPGPAAKVGTGSVKATPQPPDRTLLWVGIAALLAGGVLGLVWALRRREPTQSPGRASGSLPPRESTLSAATATSASPATPATHTQATAAQRPAPTSQRPAGGGFICPTCRQGYARPGECTRDGAALVPYADFVHTQKEREQASRRRCPECGELYPESKEFCGRDGSRLESA